MPDLPRRDLGERTFSFACDVVNYCRELSKEPGVVRHIAWQLAEAARLWRQTIRKQELLACDLGPREAATRLQRESNELVAIFTASMRKLRL